ncbi:MAG: hypothetical protein AAB729_02540, partial [Patescibacteria group bacterium]
LLEEVMPQLWQSGTKLCRCSGSYPHRRVHGRSVKMQKSVAYAIAAGIVNSIPALFFLPILCFNKDKELNKKETKIYSF